MSKRPSQNHGAILLILATTASACTGEKLTEYFEVQQVTNSRNYSVRPIIVAGDQTPYTQLQDWQKLRVWTEAIDALENAGYGHDKPDGTHEFVGESFRFTDARAKGQHRPRFFINEKPYDREKANAQGDVRRLLENGTQSQKKELQDVLNRLKEQEVPLDEAMAATDDISAI